MKDDSGASDHITNLPSNLIETILIHLPLRDAARTSVLSSHWRYSWRNLPKLTFDDTFANVSLRNLSLSQLKLLTVIYQVLLLHNGPILKFTLSLPGLQSCPEIDPIIHFVVSKGVQDLTFHIRRGEHHKLPLSLFSCHQLMHLDLQFCVFKIPSSFTGFSNLISLTLCEVLIDAETLSCLLSSCHILECLTLESSTIYENIDIVAPKLKCLRLKAHIVTLSIRHAPLLVTMSLCLKYDIHEQAYGGIPTHTITGLSSSPPIIEDLHIDHHYLKSLTAGSLPAALDNLKVVKLCEKHNCGRLVLSSWYFRMKEFCPNVKMKMDVSNTYFTCEVAAMNRDHNVIEGTTTRILVFF